MEAMGNGAPRASEDMETSTGHYFTLSDNGDVGMLIGWDGEDNLECLQNWLQRRILTFLILLTSC